ncbi:1,2-phenylacetyl-CoA epoxidase subunit PaaC [Microbaculum marinum]|uniref:1,2-phenylacetyl-CoA epoxidase subunit PaaC n=1 Tax=Microbaculum marinum TaxID=1764581 RepID=A0AAW9RXT0_9HYPH
MAGHSPELREALFELLLRLGDDCLILGHRVSEWCGHAPMLEEDLALPNMGLDLIGQARSLYTYAGEVEGNGRTEDDLAYLRNDRQYRNLLLVERPNGDFAHTMLRQLYFAAFMEPYWRATCGSKDETLAGIAGKAVKEMAYHIRHAGQWVIRMGDGTQGSARRMKDAVEELGHYVDEMFGTDAVTDALAAAGIAPDPAALRPDWDRTIEMVFSEANLKQPQIAYPQRGGRDGLHGEDLGHLLAELQYMQRTYPGLNW